MSNQNSTRIWENDSSASPPNSSPSRPAQLPSIATLTNNLPSGADNPASPAFSNHRSSDQWATPPQSTRKLDLYLDQGTTDLFGQGLRRIPLATMATIIRPRSAHPIEPPILANLEPHHIRQASLTIPRRLQGLLLLSIAWASQRSTSNTKTLPNTEAAMNSLRRILAAAAWAVKSMGSTIYTSTALLPLHIKVPISRSHLLLPVSSVNEAYRIRMAFVIRERPPFSSQCHHSRHILESLDRPSLRGQLLLSVQTR